MKNNPEKLRAQAQRLIEAAEKIERETAVKVGRITLKHAKDKFADLQNFKSEIDKILNPASAKKGIN